MLDILRRRANTWIVKILFSVIIVVFVLFFGYSKMGSEQPNKEAVASVNGTIIGRGEMTMDLERMEAQYKQIFKDGIPDNMRSMMQQNTMSGLIQRHVLAQYANHNGISISDTELLEVIRNIPAFQSDGQFDPIGYTKQVLPYYRQKYHLNFETYLRNALLAEKVRDAILEQVTLTDNEAHEAFIQDKTKLSIDDYSVPATISESVTGESVANELIAELTAGKPVAKKVKELKVEKKPLSLSVSGLSQHFQQASTDQIATIASLTMKAPVLATPLHDGNSWHVLVLTAISEPTPADWEKEKETFTSDKLEKKKDRYFRDFIDQLMAKSEINTFVDGN